MNTYTFEFNKAIRESINQEIEEGLNVYDNREIEITDDHEDGVDTSINTNPTKCTFKVSDDLTIDLYSIFTRNDKLENDGNPLLYALKNEHDYKFKSRKALNFFWKRFDEILDKFVKQYEYKDSTLIYCEEPLYDGGILLPSNHYINSEIDRRLKQKYNNKLLIIDDILLKLDPEEILDECLLPDSYFSKYWKKYGDEKYNEMKKLLSIKLRNLIKNNKSFSIHSIPVELRPSIINTMKLNGRYINAYISNITNKNILFIDDSITFGQSLKDAINVIKDTYKPKSITALTMLSQKQY